MRKINNLIEMGLKNTYRSRIDRPQPPQQWSAVGDELSVDGSSLSIFLYIN